MTALEAPPRSTLADAYQRARDLYAAAPSHASADSFPPRGTYCVVTALSECGLPFGPLKRFVGVDQLFQWNALKSTETVLKAWDRYIASLEDLAA